MSSAVTKKGITCKHRLNHQGDGVPSNLTGKTVLVRLSAGATTIAATSTVEPQAGATLSYFNFDVTAANLVALGLTAVTAVEQMQVHVTIQNTDGTLFASASGVLDVVL